MLFWNSLLVAFSALFPLLNPFGSALVMLGLVGPAPLSDYKALARRIAVDTIIFLTVIELAGAVILQFFGISLPIVQVSGGLVIAATAWSLLNEKDAHANAQEKQEILTANTDAGARELQKMAFYPLTFPITAGPGTLVVMMTLSAHVASANIKANVLGHLGVFTSVLLLSVMIYFCYAYAPKLTGAMSPSTAHGILRVIAFILFCIGVQIAWNGLSVLVGPLLKA